MRSKTTRRFRAQLAALPETVQRQAQEAYQLFRDNPSHPSLRLKPVGPRGTAMYSIRIGRRYRAIGLWEQDVILWV